MTWGGHIWRTASPTMSWCISWFLVTGHCLWSLPHKLCFLNCCNIVVEWPAGSVKENSLIAGFSKTCESGLFGRVLQWCLEHCFQTGIWETVVVGGFFYTKWAFPLYSRLCDMLFIYFYLCFYFCGCHDYSFVNHLERHPSNLSRTSAMTQETYQQFNTKLYIVFLNVQSN